ncbi:MAG: hypothetical protein STSR0002_25570 [Smithella sp.]
MYVNHEYESQSKPRGIINLKNITALRLQYLSFTNEILSIKRAVLIDGTTVSKKFKWQC